MAEIAAHGIGDFVVQSDWMALRKTESSWPAAVHAVTYTLSFVPLTRDWRRLAVIGGTHFVIDRWRLAKYVCWAKNQLVPAAYRYPWDEHCSATGYRDSRPEWLNLWLMIFADNALHMTINHFALGDWFSTFRIARDESHGEVTIS